MKNIKRSQSHCILASLRLQSFGRLELGISLHLQQLRHAQLPPQPFCDYHHPIKNKNKYYSEKKGKNWKVVSVTFMENFRAYSLLRFLFSSLLFLLHAMYNLDDVGNPVKKIDISHKINAYSNESGIRSTNTYQQCEPQSCLQTSW